MNTNEEQQNESLWLPCPRCGARSKIEIYEDTVLLNFPLYCTKCKQETKLGVIKIKIVVSDEPDAQSAGAVSKGSPEKKSKITAAVP